MLLRPVLKTEAQQIFDIDAPYFGVDPSDPYYLPLSKYEEWIAWWSQYGNGNVFTAPFMGMFDDNDELQGYYSFLYLNDDALDSFLLGSIRERDFVPHDHFCPQSRINECYAVYLFSIAVRTAGNNDVPNPNLGPHLIRGILRHVRGMRQANVNCQTAYAIAATHFSASILNNLPHRDVLHPKYKDFKEIPIDSQRMIDILNRL
jgi:hypothetical protein